MRQCSSPCFSGGDTKYTSFRSVLIIDPGIANQNGYPAWDDGLQQDIFLKDKNGNVFIGRVWPGSTAFPDFLNPKTAAYWKQEVLPQTSQPQSPCS